MVLCGTKNGSSMVSLWRTFYAPLFLRVFFRHKGKQNGSLEVKKFFSGIVKHLYF